MNKSVKPLTGIKRVLATIAIWLFVILFIVWGAYAVSKVGDMFLGSIKPITEFSYEKNVLSFQDYDKNQYRLPLPKDIVIKPTDNLELRYITNRGEISLISAVYVNGNLVYSGDPNLPFVITKFK